jgi:predicted dehydrogenase
MAKQHDRRDFLKTSAVAGAGFWLSGIAAAEDRKTPLETIRFGCIGIGNMGGSDGVGGIASVAREGDIVALCEVDSNLLGKAGAKYPKAEKFEDFRKMFDAVGKSIDAVIVSTPDHSHAVITAQALRMGKHCYTQKPLTRTLYETRRLAEIAREKKVITQMGNQGTADSRLREAAALVRAGALGTVKEVHVWSNRPIWPQGGARPKDANRPESLNWDLWLGPAAERPFANGYHPTDWRGYWDFGAGALGDMGCHTMNQPFMALDLRDPISIEAESSGHDKYCFPKWSVIRYQFPERGKRPALSMTWYDGGKLPAAELIDGAKPAASGCLIIGDKGKVYSPGDGGDRPQWLGGATKPKVEFTQSAGHLTEFAKAIKGGPAPVSNFPDYAGPLTETVLLGNLAVWAGKKVEWDAQNLKAKNCPEVETLVKPVYRKGWTL